MALLVLLSAIAPPLHASARARKRRKFQATELAANPNPAATDPAATNPPVLPAGAIVSNPAAATAVGPGMSVSTSVTTTRPPRLGENLPALKAPPSEDVRGATSLTAAAASGPQRVNPNGERIPDVLRLYPNESKIIKVEGLKRVSITNQNIADVVIVSPEEILVLPNQAGLSGRTSCYFWDKDGRKEIRIVVIGRTEESAISDQIQRDINLPGLTVDYINNRIILRGKVRNQAERQYAMDIAGLYGAPILPILEVEGIALDPKEALVKLLNLPDVKITIVNTALQTSQAQLGAGGQVVSSQPGAPPTAAPAGAGVVPSAPLYVSANAGTASASTIPQPGAAGGPGAGGAGTPGPAGGLAGGATLPPPPAAATVMVLLEGTVDDEQDKQKADEITRAFFNVQDQFGRGQAATVINNIEVLKPVQVMVEGMLLEFNSTNQKQLDYRWGTQPETGIIPGGELTEPPLQPADNLLSSMNFLETPVANTVGQFTHTGATLSGSGWPIAWPFTNSFNRLDPLLVNIRWAISNNKARVLASPKVVTRSGQLASINVGGTIPLQTAAGLGATAVQLLRFGTQMLITPTVDHRGNIDTKVTISVSDAQGTAGATRNRDTSTRVTVRDGQHIVISGLVQDQDQLIVGKVPFFGDIPWLGRLFQTKTHNKSKTELVAVITPRLLDAVEKDEEFAAANYGEMGPSRADLRAANKGGKAMKTAAKTGPKALASLDQSSEETASSALEKARRETEARVAKLSGSPSKDSTAIDTKSLTNEPQLSQRQAQVRALFEKLKAEEDGTSDPSAATSDGPRLVKLASAAGAAPTAASRESAVTGPGHAPLMTAAPFPSELTEPSPFVPTAGGVDGERSSQPSVRRVQRFGAGEQVASASNEPRPAPEAVSEGGPARPVDDSIERVSKKIDDLFDKLDERMASHGQ